MTDTQWKPAPGRDAMTRDGRRVTNLTLAAGGAGMSGDISGRYDTWFRDGRSIYLGASHLDLVRDADPLPAEPDKPAIPSPVRQRTVTEIVPGVYGRVRIIGRSSPGGDVLMKLVNRKGLDQDGGNFTASELRAAATILTQVADAMEVVE